MLFVLLLIADNIFFISICWRSQIKVRTLNNNSAEGSHVMQYGDIGLSQANFSLYIGANGTNTFVDPSEDYLWSISKAIDQRDANLIHFWANVCSPTLSISC